MSAPAKKNKQSKVDDQLKDDQPKDEQNTTSKMALKWLLVAMLVALVFAVFYSIQTGGRASWLSMSSVSVMLAGAAAFVGGAIGFLFGIPRTLQQEGQTDVEGRLVPYRANTNLEQISDWLTKILVGVSLTQLPEIREHVTNLVDFAAQALGSPVSGKVFALALLSFSLFWGFFFGFLWTRLFLVGAFRVADQVDTLARLVKENSDKLTEMEKQSATDAKALGLVTRQLTPIPEDAPVAQDELNAALKAASGSVKVQALSQAWKMRSENQDTDKKALERTIPVFRALIAADGDEKKYHMNYGQLAFALKDKDPPDWVSANEALTTAITIRDAHGDDGWNLYETNRALCRIKIDPEFNNGRPTGDDVKKLIVKDLEIAVKVDWIQKKIETEPWAQPIRDWMQLNNVTMEALLAAAP